MPDGSVTPPRETHSSAAVPLRSRIRVRPGPMFPALGASGHRVPASCLQLLFVVLRFRPILLHLADPVAKRSNPPPQALQLLAGLPEAIEEPRLQTVHL